ncbi:hypothetical protein KY308_03895 [Candidatus Woesearchaeota archaeon]|nr:hypothetical protein [Candidatus Woesearchaeota archaeon]
MEQEYSTFYLPKAMVRADLETIMNQVAVSQGGRAGRVKANKERTTKLFTFNKLGKLKQLYVKVPKMAGSDSDVIKEILLSHGRLAQKDELLNYQKSLAESINSYSKPSK